MVQQVNDDAQIVKGRLIIPLPNGKKVEYERSLSGLWVKSKDTIEQMREMHRIDKKREFDYIPDKERVIIITAFNAGLNVMTKGPTGVGKTLMIKTIAAKMGLPLITENCNERTSLATLHGTQAPILVGNGTEFQWNEGSAYLAAKMGENGGAILYLDEFFELRRDVAVSLHSLLSMSLEDRELNITATNEKIRPSTDFHVIGSYNPGAKYQDSGKAMKPSTALRFVQLYMDGPDPEVEALSNARRKNLKYVIINDKRIDRSEWEKRVKAKFDKEKAYFEQVDDNKQWAKSEEGQIVLANFNEKLTTNFKQSIRGLVPDHAKGTPGSFLEDVAPKLSEVALGLIQEGLPAMETIKVTYSYTLSDFTDEQKAVTELAYRLMNFVPKARFDWN
jgi:MoxR-like ATPase